MSTLTTAGITFGDATSQTTAATAAAFVTTTNVLNATAGASAGAVGTYAFAFIKAGSALSFGSTIAGSGLETTDAQLSSSGSGTTLSGTWRCMGRAYSGNQIFTITLYLRTA
jgi:hypothetical protein